MGHTTEDVYKRLLWLMKRDADSPIEPHAGVLYTDDSGLLGEYATVDELLAAHPTIARHREAENGEGPLFWAAIYGPLALVERLESLGADPRATLTDSLLVWHPSMEVVPAGGTTLMMAAAGGRDDVVRHLLQRGVPADAVAHDAAAQGAPTVGPGAPERGVTALFLAARDRGTGAVIDALVAAGADPNRADEYGFTALGQAAKRGAVDCVQALVRAGADPHVKSGDRSVMELAAEADDPAVLQGMVAASFGRLLALDDVTAALSGAGIEHEVLARAEAGDRLVRSMVVYGEMLDENHYARTDTPTWWMWWARSDDALRALDLEEELERRGIGPRRFASDGEVKAALGIGAGGVTPFALANDRGDAFVSDDALLGGGGPIAVEAFDAERVVVLDAARLDDAVAAFAAAVGPAKPAPEPAPAPAPPRAAAVPPPLAADAAPGASAPAATPASSAAEADESLPRGCLWSLLLMLVALFGFTRSCWMPVPSDQVFDLKPGQAWQLTVPTNLTTVKGLARFDDARAEVLLEPPAGKGGAAETLPITVRCDNQDDWRGGIDVDIVTVKGVPVISGREDVTLVFHFTFPDDPAWDGRSGTLKTTGTIVYPFYDYDDAVVGGVTGKIKWEQRTLAYEGSWPVTFSIDGEARRKARDRESLWDMIFLGLGVVALVLAFRGAKHLPDAKPKDGNEST